MQLVSCTKLGGMRGNDETTNKEENDDDIGSATVERIRAEAEKLRAEAYRLRAEGKMFEDIGSYYVELASKAEAEAFIAQADRTTHEMVQDAVRKLKSSTGSELLLVEKARSEIEREIARNKDLATKNSNRSPNNRPPNRGNGDQRRKPYVPMPEKEVTGVQKVVDGVGEAAKPFNAIRGKEAQAAMKSETRP